MRESSRNFEKYDCTLLHLPKNGHKFCSRDLDTGLSQAHAKASQAFKKRETATGSCRCRSQFWMANRTSRHSILFSNKNIIIPQFIQKRSISSTDPGMFKSFKQTVEIDRERKRHSETTIRVLVVVFDPQEYINDKVVKFNVTQQHEGWARRLLRLL